MSMIEPEVGQWYQNTQRQLFEVVAVDDDTVEIQYYDGDVEEMDLETWYQMNLVMTAEPNDASAPYDDLDMDEFGPVDETASPGGLQNMLDEL